MADQIIQSAKILDADEEVLQWDFSYSVESGGKINTFAVVVKAEEMTDPTSESEAKTKANVKAGDIKDAWVDSLATATEDVPVITEPENVTL